MTLGSGVRAMLFIGFAYFLVAVLVPAMMLATQAQPGAFNGKGAALGLLAGALGALGAVGIVFAFFKGGSPLYVMPLVFSGAPLVNVVVSLILHPPKEAPHPMLYLGFIMAAVGAYLVLRYKPA
jgi:hypothetical protein